MSSENNESLENKRANLKIREMSCFYQNSKISNLKRYINSYCISY